MRVLLGIGGGIAAYKAAELVRLLRGDGHEVRCCPTRHATAFVAPLTLEVLSGRPLLTEAYLEPGTGGREEHIDAAAWTDVLCVAPATADLLARLSLGIAGDVLTTTALAVAGPWIVAPAMHGRMWAQPQVQEHVERLRTRGVRIVGPEYGALASGESGWGRMAEPAKIAAEITAAVRPGPLQDRRIVVTAGPTYEPIDPVRFLGNRSSGRMGFAIAAEAAGRGAAVTLIAGPVALPTPGGVRRLDVETAAEMRQATLAAAAEADAVVMAAAVADFRPAAVAPVKIKKGEAPPAPLALARNPDILTELATAAPGALRVGFAAETGDLAREALAKLERKGCDLIVANDVSAEGIGFASPDNEVTIFRRRGEPLFLSRRPKEEIARALLDLVTQELAERGPSPAAGR